VARIAADTCYLKKNQIEIINVNPLALCSMMMDAREYGGCFGGWMDGWICLTHIIFREGAIRTLSQLYNLALDHRKLSGV
jgi:hypothetical protein